MKCIFDNKENYYTQADKKYLTIAYEFYKNNNVNPVKVNRKVFYFESDNRVVIDPVAIENGYKGVRHSFKIVEK